MYMKHYIKQFMKTISIDEFIGMFSYGKVEYIIPFNTDNYKKIIY